MQCLILRTTVGVSHYRIEKDKDGRYCLAVSFATSYAFFVESVFPEQSSFLILKYLK